VTDYEASGWNGRGRSDHVGSGSAFEFEVSDETRMALFVLPHLVGDWLQ
jgi:hypothetical protein